jgi:uncharacterized protein YggE
MRIPMNRIAAIALLSLVLLVPTAAHAQERTIAVTGSVTSKVPNDTAGLGFSVSQERRSRGAALRAVARRLRAVIVAVQKVPGVGPGDIETGRISVRKVSTGERFLYRAGEGIGVVLHQPENAGDLVATAIRAGATGTSGPNFFVGDTELAYGKALAAAFDGEKPRATALAAEAGSSLGVAITIEEGGGVELSPDASVPQAKSSPGCATTPVAVTAKRCTTPPVKPGTSTVTATVRVVFALQ